MSILSTSGGSAPVTAPDAMVAGTIGTGLDIIAAGSGVIAGDYQGALANGVAVALPGVLGKKARNAIEATGLDNHSKEAVQAAVEVISNGAGSGAYLQ